ncbi:MAG: tRNA pseudouridine(38-40) synthase TruA [Actinomycetaceae bacterium]|nr:tRNA pseudouridine(38-40) synthase TruA [Arcanobacterium sp.]MDD7504326.1 tRNA pseudouridine(38-40) synthase TruA [Actinomycetaceae bacterium]MDY6143925.1 tRNA pseudouridine(38-40) synthase TruA [Arcanobacterium sp.]
MRIRLDIAYCGESFHGWARQPGQRTVQGEIEAALATILRGAVELTVAGRTDAGVHARGQVAHFDISADTWRELGGRAKGEPTASLLKSLNAILAFRARQQTAETGGAHRSALPREYCDVVIRGVQQVPDTFDARFSALWRRYTYRICDGVERWNPMRRDELWLPSQLNVDAMNRASSALLGEHDFLSFCRPREGASTVRTLYELRFERGEDGVLVGNVRADAFCHSQVRTLMGTLIEVGRGARGEDWPGIRLRERLRDGQVIVAPPRPLTLEEVGYAQPQEYGLQAQRARRYRGA